MAMGTLKKKKNLALGKRQLSTKYIITIWQETS